jgi:beta-lactamase regulating signal transducer with metallopeptidase domain
LDTVLHAVQSLDPAGRALVIAANAFAQTGFIVLLALVLSRTFARRSAAARHGVWSGALACVVISAAMAAAIPQGRLCLVRLSSTGSREAPDESPASPADPAIPARAAATGAADAGDKSAAPIDPGRLRSLRAGTTPPGLKTAFHRAANPFRVTGGAILAVWLAGVLPLLARLAWGWRWMRGVQRTARPPATPIPPAVLDAVRRALGGADVPPIRESARVAGPVSVGLLRPVVVLPPGLAAALEPDSLRDVLIHECAHVCRRDQWVGLAQRLVAIALWPHPLVHLLNRELGRAREEICDNYVLAGQANRAQARGYARALLALAESIRDARRSDDLQGWNRRRGRPPTHPPLPAIGILGPGWPLEARVAGLLDTRRTVMTRLTPRTRLLAVICFCAATLAAAGTRLIAAAAEDDPKPVAPAKPPVQASERGAGGGAEGASARDDAKDPKPRADTRPTTNASEALAAQLDRVLPEVSFDGVAFTDVLDFFRDVSGANVVVDWKGLESAGVNRNTPLSYKAKDVRFRGALKEILTLAGDAKHPVTFAAADGVVFVSTPARARRFEGESAAWVRKVADDPTRAKLARVLPEVRFDGVALGDVIDFLRDVSGVTINVHWKELEAAGVDRNAPVTLRLREASFGQALQLVLFTTAPDKSPEFAAEDGRVLIRAAAAADPPAASAPKAEKDPDRGDKSATPRGR